MLEEEWPDEDSRVSVTVMAAPPINKSDPPVRSIKRAVTVVSIIVASATAAAVTAWTTLHEMGVLK